MNRGRKISIKSLQNPKLSIIDPVKVILIHHYVMGWSRQSVLMTLSISPPFSHIIIAYRITSHSRTTIYLFHFIQAHNVNSTLHDVAPVGPL